MAFGVLEEGDNLLQLVLGFVDAGNIGEGDLYVLLHIDLGLALADRHQATRALTHSHGADEKHPNEHEADRRHEPPQHGLKEPGPGLAGEGQLFLDERLRQSGLDAVRRKMRDVLVHRLLVGAGDLSRSNDEISHLALIDEPLKLAVWDRLRVSRLEQQVLDQHHRHDGGDDVKEVDLVLALDLHFRSSNTSLRLDSSSGRSSEPRSAE
jgi:hypothetical protein